MSLVIRVALVLLVALLPGGLLLMPWALRRLQGARVNSAPPAAVPSQA